jgi:hypothetical protein
MSHLGHKRTSQDVRVMSALPPKADIAERNSNVCFGPLADKVQCKKESTRIITPAQRSSRVRWWIGTKDKNDISPR